MMKAKSRASRVVSALLTLCMVIGMLPGITLFTASAAATADLYYDFEKVVASTSDTAFMQTVNYDMTTTGGASEMNPGVVSEPYAFYGYDPGTAGAPYWTADSNNYGFWFFTGNRANNYTATIKIKVSTGGKYIPMLNMHGAGDYANAGFMDISLTDMEGNVLATRGINQQNYYLADHYVPLSTTPVELTDNSEYLVKFNANKIYGVTIVDGFKLVAADTAVASDVKIGSEEGLYEVVANESVIVPLTVTMSDGSAADLSKATFEYSAADIVTAEVADGALKLTGVAEGTTTLTVRMGNAMARTNINVVATATVPTARDLTFNFLKSMPKSVTAEAAYGYSATHNYAHSTAGAYGEVNGTLTSDPYAVYSKKDAEGNENPNMYFARFYQNYGYVFYDKGTVTIRFKVPVDGMYAPTVNLFTNSNSDTNYVIKKVGASIEASNKTLPTTAGAGDNAISDGNIALTAGEYELIMTKTKAGQTYISNLKLAYKGELGAVSLNATAQESATVETDKTVDVPVTIGLSDNSAIDYSKVTVATTFGTTDVASATSTVGDSSAKVTFTGLKPGTTKATITVTYNETLTKSVDVNVTVVAPLGKTLQASTSEGLAKMAVGGSKSIPLTLSLKDGSEIDYSTITGSVTFGASGIATGTFEKTASSASVKFTGVAAGKTTATIKVSNGTTEATVSCNIEVTEAGASATVTDLIYDLKKGWVDSSSNTVDHLRSITYAMTETGSSSEIVTSRPSAAWAYQSDNSSGGNNYFKYNYASYGICKSQVGTGTLKLKVPVSGEYIPYATLYNAATGVANITLRKYDPATDTVGAIVAQLKDATVDITRIKDYQLGTGKVQLDAGEYALEITAANVSGSFVIIDAFKLISAENFLDVTSDAETLTSITSSTGSVTLTVKDSKGNEIPASDLTVTLSGNDETIATVANSVSGDKIVITATSVKKGNTFVTAEVVDASNRKGSIVIPIAVVNEFEIDAKLLNFNETLEVGKSVTVDLSAKIIRPGQTTGEEGAVTVTAVSKDTSKLDVAVVAGEGGKNNKITFTSKAIGNTMVTITIKSGSVEKVLDIPILTYSKTKNTTNNYKYMVKLNVGRGRDISEIKNFLYTMPGTGYQIRSGLPTDAWCYAGQSDTSVFKNYYDSYGFALEHGIGMWAAINIRLPESGTYQIVNQGTTYCMSGIVRTYIAPVDAENPMDPKWSVGSEDRYLAEDQSVSIDEVKNTLRTVDLEAGDYIVTWEIAGKNSLCEASPRIYLDGLYLNAVSSVPTMTVTPDASAITVAQYGIADIPLTATLSDNSLEDLYGATFTVDSSTVDGLVEVENAVNKKGQTVLRVIGKKQGSGKITVGVTVSGVKRATFDLDVGVAEPSVLTKVELGLQANTYANTISLHATDSSKNVDDVAVRLIDQNNLEISEATVALQDYEVTYKSSDTSVATVDENGHITALKDGKTTITVTAKLSGVTQTGTMELTVTSGGKIRSSYYTAERVAAMRENARNYDWANSAMLSAVNSAEKYVGEHERLWSAITSQELPRSYYVGYRGDPEYGNCRFCGVDLIGEYGSPYYAWIMDAWNKPWKVQCPDCRKSFPTNDFEKFYALGIGEDGFWHYELAKSENAKLVAAGQPGYLVNETLPEKGEGWGVDDGYGYVSDKTFNDSNSSGSYNETIPSVHTYISFYNHWGLWHSSLILNSVTALTNAYLYTGDIKYGRVGAIMIDRIADVYPDMTTEPYRYQMASGAYYNPRGKVTDYVWENQLAEQWALSYDAFWPAYEDSQVVSFLSEKAAQYNMPNPKTDARLIRTNVEDGLLREIFEACKTGHIWGNFGMSQSTLTAAAIVLDTMPDTKEMLDFVFQDGDSLYLNGSLQVNKVTGGNVYRQLVNAVDSNGVSDEVSPNYSDLWLGGLKDIAKYTAGYDKYPSADLYNNPRYVKMHTWQVDTFLRRAKMPAIGDSGATAMNAFQISTSRLIPAFENTKDISIAQMIYHLNGKKVEGLHYDAMTKNPESLQTEIMDIIRTHGEYNFDKSTHLTDYGFAALRGGSLYGSGINELDTQRVYWMYYGRYAGHGHRDALNLGFEAFKLDLAPDLGYPTTSSGPEDVEWAKTTVSHNTVVVNNASQKGVRTTGVPYHFDDAGRVKLMDADASHQYGISDYRRTVVTVDVDEENTYAVDFFHVNGGDEHLYSFHALSNSLTTTGLNLVPQQKNGEYVGSYMGANWPYAQTDANRTGFNYLYNVDRAANVTGGNFSVDFKIMNVRNTYVDDPNVHLKMTMVNGFDLSEVAIATGTPPRRDYNPEALKYVLARRSGSNLNTLFTTVFEPYKAESNIEKIEDVPVVRADGQALTESDNVKAVKVTLKDGRVDYVVFTRRTSVEYKVDNLFNVKGFVAVYSMKDGKNIYSYINDGSKVGDLTGRANVTGKIVDFTEGLQFNNAITISTDESVPAKDLIGRYIYVNRVGSGNATFEIKNAYQEGNNIVLDIGDVSLVDKVGDDGEYVYHIMKDQTFRIPLNLVADSAPQIEPIADQTADAGAEFKLTIKAESTLDTPIKYSLVSGPSGIVVDEDTGVLTWVPSSSHRGTHAVVVKASNGTFDSTETFNVTVFGSSPSPGPVTGGGGGGGGGEAKITVKFETNGGSNVAQQAVAKGATVKEPTAPTKEGYTFDGWYTDAELTTKFDFATTVSSETTLYAKWVEGEATTTERRFIDLGNHKWAEDAIYRLVDAGVVNGTSYNTYSPGVNITRADFTTLIVRAFKFEAEVATFADVDAGKYYAEPIGIAKTLGIVNGVNATDFAPTAQITRQDMMVIIYRALGVAGIKLEKTVDATFPDADTVSAYARDAVDALIGSGLIAGSNGKINPKANTTRAEVAVVLDRILNK